MSRRPRAGAARALCLGMVAVLATAPVRARAQSTPEPPASPSASPEPSPSPEAIPSGTTPPPAPEPVPPSLTPAPSPAPAVTPTPVTIKKRPHPGLLASGLVLFVGGWVGDIAFTYGYDHPPGWTSLIPIAGPFIQLTESYGLDGPPVNSGNPDADARITRNIDQANSTIRGLALAGAAIAGVCQIAGLALVIAGAATKGRRVTRYASALAALAGGGLRLSF